MTEFARVNWQPQIIQPIEWHKKYLTEYLNSNRFTLFSNGSCVVWSNAEKMSSKIAIERLLLTIKDNVDFKVRKHSSGDYLVTFKGGIGGLMSGSLLRSNFTQLYDEAFSLGLLPHETLISEKNIIADDFELVAGLYVRAQLYRDAELLIIVE